MRDRPSVRYLSLVERGTGITPEIWIGGTFRHRPAACRDSAYRKARSAPPRPSAVVFSPDGSPVAVGRPWVNRAPPVHGIAASQETIDRRSPNPPTSLARVTYLCSSFGDSLSPRGTTSASRR